MKGPDQMISIEPKQFRELRDSLDNIDKIMKPLDNQNRADLHVKNGSNRGAYAKSNIQKGEIINDTNTIFMRPQTMITPQLYYLIDGKRAQVDYQAGDPILF